MKITICGSMAFFKEMISAKNELERLGHIVFIPEGTDKYVQGKIDKNRMDSTEGVKRKMVNDFIRKHCQLIANSDAILVLNYEKKGIWNYIGGNSFLEIGYAYILRKFFF